jgi:hypothetical protein
VHLLPSSPHRCCFMSFSLPSVLLTARGFDQDILPRESSACVLEEGTLSGRFFLQMEKHWQLHTAHQRPGHGGGGVYVHCEQL